MTARDTFLRVVTAALSATVCALLIEALCQLYAAYLKTEWQRLQQHAHHYYIGSDDPDLVYAVASARNIVHGGKVLVTNRFGLRETTDAVAPAGECSIGPLGDSIVFGNDVSQDATFCARLCGGAVYLHLSFKPADPPPPELILVSL